MLIRRLIFDAIECQCRIGVYDHERLGPQRVVIDIEIELSAETEPRRDYLDDTLNYDLVRDTVLKIAQSQHFDLQETLARALFDSLADMPSVTGLRVRTAKPDAYADCRQVAYELDSRVSAYRVDP